MPEPALETSGLTKRYGDVTALADLDLRVERGEVFGFLGPNGAGKTTTIDLLLDFIRPTAGSTAILGETVQTDPDTAREPVGILPDGVDLWGRSTGRRHLEFALESTGGTATPETLAERVGLEPEAMRRRTAEYSKGMKQRLAMAMALAGDPDVLILDEPSSGLDPHGIRTMQRIVREEAAAGTTVFFSSHILGQVAAVCDRVGILDGGTLVAVDPIDRLREAADVGSRLVCSLGAEPSVELADLASVTASSWSDGELAVTYTDPAAKARILHRLVEDGCTVRDFSVEEPTLEDLFDVYTGNSTTEVPA